LLQRKLNLTERDAAVAPLGIPGQASADDVVLAGRFHDDKVPLVSDLVRQAGGEIVANVDEVRTKPRDLRPGPLPGTRGTTVKCQMSGQLSARTS
jgi:hypothetical protein